jgi:hypothetical protein
MRFGTVLRGKAPRSCAPDLESSLERGAGLQIQGRERSLGLQAQK